MKYVIKAFIIGYLGLMLMYLANIYFMIYLDTGEFPIKKEDFFFPIKPMLTIIVLQYFLRLILPSKEEKQKILKEIEEERKNNKK